MRKSARTVLAIAGIAVFAAGGSAFTASNSFDTGATAPLTGYGSTTVSGATIKTLSYTLNAGGDNVDSVSLVLDGNTTGSTVSIGFNGGAVTPCGTGDNTTDATVTAYICKNGASNFVRSTLGLTSTAVVVN
ncbi:MAG: hypothetical protein QOI42_97 [Frankiaceae bacterium]|jgi:hypothetical protein|nr:hypothetical protein [Frankiaceae bacterium]